MPGSGWLRVASQRKRSASRASSTSPSHGAESRAVGERPVAVRDPQPVALERVVEHPVRDELEARGRERRLLLVLVHVEELEDRVRVEDGIEPVQRLAAAVRQPQLGRLLLAARAEQAAERPRHEVAPVVEVEVGDDDGVESRPRLEPAQAGQHARAAVEQDPAAVLLDEIARLGAAGVGPGGRAAYDVHAHAPILAVTRGCSHGEAQLCITAPWPEPPSTC